MAPWRTLSVALQASTAGYVRGLTGAAAATKTFGNQAERSFKQADRAANGSGATADRTARRWRSFGQTAALGIAAVGIALGFSLKEAISWESAFAGVVKTVDGTEAELGELEDRLLGMARRLPATRGEIAGVAEAAGQLGVALPDIARFTETMIALGVSTNLSSDDAATGLARMMNIMGTASDDVERLGATLVDLGNKGASTESEILRMATRMAGGGRLIGLTEANVLSLSNALSSIGVQAELGSGVMTRFFTKLYSAAQRGKLDDWAAAARMSVEDFTRTLSKDPAKAIDAFVAGLSRTREEGGNVIQLLEDVGLKGTLNIQVLTSLAGASDVLTQSFKDGNQAWEEGTALAEEAAKRYETAESKIRVFGNKVTDVARQVGAALIPMFLGALDAAERFGAWMGRVGLDVARRLERAWGDLSGAGRDLARILGVMWDTAQPVAELFAKLGGAAIIGGISLLAAALSEITGFLTEHEWLIRATTTALMGLAFAKAWPLIVGALETIYLQWLYFSGAVKGTAIVSALSTIGTGFATMTTSATIGLSMIRTGLASLLSPTVGIAAVAIAALSLGTAWKRAGDDAEAPIAKLKPANFDAASIQSQRQYVDNLTSALAAAGAAQDKLGDGSTWGKIKAASGGTAQAIGSQFGLAEQKILNTYRSHEELMEAVAAQESELAVLRRYWSDVYGEIENVSMAGKLLAYMDIGPLEQWAKKLNLDPTILTVEEMAAAIEGASNAAEHGTPKTDKLATSYNVLADATSNSTDKLKAWQDQVDAILGTEKGIFDATTSWNDSLMAFTETTTESIDGKEVTRRVLDLSAGLDDLTEAAQKNRGAVSGAVDAAIDLAVAYGERDGIEAANYALELNRQRLVDVMVQAGLTREEAQEYLDVLGLTPENIQTIIATNAAEAQAGIEGVTGALEKVPAGKVINLEVRTWWDSASQELAKVLASSGTGVISTGAVFGGGARWGAIHSYARGGIHAQVGRGDLIRWAEPETEMEAYIPKRGDRSRSVSILGEAASWFGLGLHPKNSTGALSFAAGGITGIQPSGFIQPPEPRVIVVQAGGGNTSYGPVNINTPRAARDLGRRDIETAVESVLFR